MRTAFRSTQSRPLLWSLKQRGKTISRAVLAGLLGILALSGCSHAEEQDSPAWTEESGFSMDTLYTLRQTGGTPVSLTDMLAELDWALSPYQEGGDIFRVNQVGGVLTPVGADALALSRKALECAETYGGKEKADVTAGKLVQLWGISSNQPKVPAEEEIAEALSTVGWDNLDIQGEALAVHGGAELDFGSMAKGYACGRVREALEEGKVSCAVFSMTSSSLLYGKKPDGSLFTIEVKNPDGGPPLGYLHTEETFLSTSGGYERFFEADGKRYSHLLDLSTGRPTESDLTSVTVLCDDGAASDYLSTLIFLEGTAGLKSWLSYPGILVAAADQEKNLYLSPGLDFSPNPESGYQLASGGDS